MAQPIRIVVPVPPGGMLDTTARLVAQHWQTTTGTPVIVENKPGANMLIGTEFVARAPADGRTLLFGATMVAISPSMMPGGAIAESLVPVVQVSTETYGLFTKAGGPASIDELVRLANSRAGGVDCLFVPGAPGIGCEQLARILKGRSTTIPHSGQAPALNALLGGHGDVLFTALPGMSQYMNAGAVQLLAISSHKGVGPELSKVPLLRDVWPGFVLDGFSGLFAPKGTPPELVQQVNREINEVLKEEQVRVLMQSNSQGIVGGPPDVLAQTRRAAQKEYGEIVQRLNLAAPR